MTNEKNYEAILKEKGRLYQKVKGISMLPMIHQGQDIIVISKRSKEHLKKYDVVLFQRTELSMHTSYVLHRILKVNSDGTYWIVGDNCCNGDIVKEEEIIGILSAVIRNGKTIRMNGLPYKLYVHLWCGLYPIRFFIIRYKRYLQRKRSRGTLD